MVPASCITKAVFHLWGQLEVDLLASLCTHQSAFYTLENPLPLEALGLNAFNHPWIHTASSSSSFSSPGSIHVLGRMCHRSVQISYSGGALLAGGFLASHSFKHVGRGSSSESHCKEPCHGCLGESGTQGSVEQGRSVTELNQLAAQRYLLHQQGFFSFVSQVVTGATQVSMTKVYQQCWREWTDGVLERVYKTMLFLPLN